MKVSMNASFYVAFSELAERRWCLMTSLTGAGFVSEHMLSGVHGVDRKKRGKIRRVHRDRFKRRQRRGGIEREVLEIPS